MHAEARLQNRAASSWKSAALGPLLMVGLTIAAMLACGTPLCFGVCIYYPLLLLSLLLAGAWAGWFEHHSKTTRLALATTFGWTAMWLSLKATAIDLPRQPHQDYYATMGFPFRGVHGHGGGGFPDYLPFEHGLAVLWLNFGILTLACWGLLHLVPKRRLRHLMALAIVLTFMACPPVGYWD